MAKNTRAVKYGYEQVYDGVWIRPSMRNYRIRCCHCGLTHDVEFRIVDRHVEMRLWINDRATAANRRTFRMATGKKLYALRDAKGRFKDIIAYQRAYEAGRKK